MSEVETSRVEKKAHRKGMTLGTLCGVFGTLAACVMAIPVLQTFASGAISHLPVIQNHEARITALEVTNQIREVTEQQEITEINQHLEWLQNHLVHQETKP